MVKYLQVFILSIFIWSCEGEHVNPAEETFDFYENARITKEHPFAVEGPNTVFHHFYRAKDEEDIADDEYAEELLFEVNLDQDFSYEGDELKALNFAFHQYCYCPMYDNIQVLNGYLNGTRKSDDKYLIEAKVEMMGYFLYEGDTIDSQLIHSAFTGYFKKASLPNK